MRPRAAYHPRSTVETQMRLAILLALLLPSVAQAQTKKFEFENNADMNTAQAAIVTAAKTIAAGDAKAKGNFRAAVVDLLAADVARRQGKAGEAKTLSAKVSGALSGKLTLASLLLDTKLNAFVKPADAFVFDPVKLASTITRWQTVGFEPIDFQTK